MKWGTPSFQLLVLKNRGKPISHVSFQQKLCFTYQSLLLCPHAQRIDLFPWFLLLKSVGSVLAASCTVPPNQIMTLQTVWRLLWWIVDLSNCKVLYLNKFCLSRGRVEPLSNLRFCTFLKRQGFRSVVRFSLYHRLKMALSPFPKGWAATVTSLRSLPMALLSSRLLCVRKPSNLIEPILLFSNSHPELCQKLVGYQKCRGSTC